MDLEQTGRFIAQARQARGLTQRELAEKIGVTDKAVSRWETGRGFPEASVLQGLAEALGVSVTELVRGERAAPEEAGGQADRAVLDALSYSAQVVRRAAGLLLLFAGVVLAALPLVLTTGGRWQGALVIWGVGMMAAGLCLYSRRMGRDIQGLSWRALWRAALAALVVALALEALPFGVAMRWMPNPDKTLITTHAYFELLPLGYGNIFPMITALSTSLAAALCLGCLVRPPAAAGHTRGAMPCTWIAFFASLPALLLYGLECVTPTGAGISLLLLLSALAQASTARPGIEG